MTFTGTAMLFILAAEIAAVAFGLARFVFALDELWATMPCTGADITLCKGTELSGELAGMRQDPSGLLRVTIRDAHGRLTYGFSSMPELDIMEQDKRDGWVRVPLEEAPAGRAYMV